MTRGGRRTHRVVAMAAACVLSVAFATGARAALNAGGVAYIAWPRLTPPAPGEIDTTSVRPIPAPGDTVTLYVRLGLVHEIKGYDVVLRWSSTRTPSCFSVAEVREGAGTSASEWIPRGDLVPVGPIVGTDSVLLVSAFNQVGIASAGIIAGITFRFPDCTVDDPGSLCLGHAYVIDSQNAVDTLTIVGDAFLGSGSPIRACGPPPPPRVDHIDTPSAFYGETVTMRISGFNFQRTPTVTLENDEGPPVLPTDLVYENATTLHATFDLAGVPFGNYVVIVRNPDGNIEPSAPTFTIKVPQAQIDSLSPRVLYSGSGAGQPTRMTINGRDFYVNGSVPTARLENGRTTLSGTNTVVESVNQVSTTFTVQDNLSQLDSPILSDHVFVLVVQNADSPEAVYNGAAYVYRPPPSITSVTVTDTIGTNFVEWEISGPTASSRFVLVRQSLRCGVVTRTKTLLDTLYTRGTKFHFVDDKPEEGRSHVYSVTQVYQLGGIDSITTTVMSTDTLGVRCPDAKGPGTVQFQTSVIRPGSTPLRVVFALATPTVVDARVFDTRGRLVRVLESGTRTGDVELQWNGARSDGDDARAGVYTVNVTVGEETTRQKVVVVP